MFFSQRFTLPQDMMAISSHAISSHSINSCSVSSNTINANTREDNNVNETVKSDGTMSQDSFSEQIRCFHSTLLGYAFNMTRDIVISHDLVQETYCRAWTARDSIRNLGSFKGWLCTILRHENTRRFARKRFTYDDFDEPSYIDKETKELDHILVMEGVFKELEALPQKYQEPLLLALVGYTSNEISQILAINCGTVLTRTRRAKLRLKEIMLSQIPI